MLGRVIIIIVGAGFASYCVVTAFLTFFGKNAATLHLTKIFLIGYAAINAVLTPFGISGIIGGISRKKTLIRAFITIQWWLATFILIGLNVFNIILSKKDKGDFVRRCQNDLAKGQPESDFLTRCVAIADDAERATFIATCAQGGIMLFLGIVLLIVGTREYNSISLEEETKNLLEKANFNEKDETDKLEKLLSSSNANNNGGNVNDSTFVPDSYDLGRYPPTNMTNVKRQPSNAVTANVDLGRYPPTNMTNVKRQPSNAVTANVDLRRYPPTNMTNVKRQPSNTVTANVDLGRYPPTNMTNVKRQPSNTVTANVDLGRYPPTNMTNVKRQPSNAVTANVDLGRYPPTNMTNVKRQPSNAVTANVDLVRRPTNASTINAVQNSDLRRHPTDPSTTFVGRNQTDPNFIPSSYKGLSRNPTSPGSIPPKGLARYPTDGSANRANVTRQPTIGSSYAPRNYVGAPQAIYPIALKRSLSTKQYINPPSPSYITQIVVPPPQINKQNIPPKSEVNEYNNYNNDYNKPNSTKTTTPYLTRN